MDKWIKEHLIRCIRTHRASKVLAPLEKKNTFESMTLKCLKPACFVVRENAIVKIIKNEGTNTKKVSVAASDSSTIIKEQSDYVCDGITDRVIIKNALSELSDGGILNLQPGNFNIRKRND